MNPFDPVFFQAAYGPRRPAIAYADGLFTYGMLAEAANRAAANISALGFKKGDRIACEIADPLLHFIVAMAISRIGAVGLSLQTDIEIDPTPLKISGSLVDQRSRVPRPRSFMIGSNIYQHANTTTVFSNQIRGEDFAPNDLWRIALSSGTTGRPKGIGFTSETAEKRLSRFNVGDSAGALRSLSLMGFSTAWGVGTVLNTLRNGGLASFAANPEQALDIVAFYCISDIVASPAQLADLVQLQRTAKRSVPSLRSITIGGAKVPRDVLIDAQRLLCPGIQVNYGATETGRVTSTDANHAIAIPGAVGYIYPWLNVEIIRENGARCGFGEEGQVRISGDSVITSYLDDDASAASQAEFTWFYPGDLATMRNDGLVTITGRAGNRINRQGVKLAPEAIEEEIDAAPGVLESCVCDFESSSGRVIMVAGVVLKPGFSLESVQAACRARLGPTRLPDEFVLASKLPRGPLGKIDRPAAKALVRAAYFET